MLTRSKGVGEHFITIPHVQAIALIATYEVRRMLFTRSLVNAAKCTRMVQMMGLDRLDGDRDDLPRALTPPTSWVEMEERRRAFWAAYTIDAHASIATGWPRLIQSDDVRIFPWSFLSEYWARIFSSQDGWANG